jgi:hypothetical protein
MVRVPFDERRFCWRLLQTSNGGRVFAVACKRSAGDQESLDLRVRLNLDEAFEFARSFVERMVDQPPPQHGSDRLCGLRGLVERGLGGAVVQAEESHEQSDAPLSNANHLLGGRRRQLNQAAPRVLETAPIDRCFRTAVARDWRAVELHHEFAP